jgi:hypothetical protein
MIELLIRSGADQKIRNCQGRTPRDCSQNIQIFNIFNTEEKVSYSKEVFGGVLRPNSRTDHIARFLNIRHNYKEEDSKLEKKNDKPTNKFVNIIKMYQAIRDKKNDTVSLKDFTFYKMLGRGSFGEVYLVKRLNE